MEKTAQLCRFKVYFFILVGGGFVFENGHKFFFPILAWSIMRELADKISCFCCLFKGLQQSNATLKLHMKQLEEALAGRESSLVELNSHLTITTQEQERLQQEYLQRIQELELVLQKEKDAGRELRKQVCFWREHLFSSVSGILWIMSLTFKKANCEQVWKPIDVGKSPAKDLERDKLLIRLKYFFLLTSDWQQDNRKQAASETTGAE